VVPVRGQMLSLRAELEVPVDGRDVGDSRVGALGTEQGIDAALTSTTRGVYRAYDDHVGTAWVASTSARVASARLASLTPMSFRPPCRMRTSGRRPTACTTRLWKRPSPQKPSFTKPVPPSGRTFTVLRVSAAKSFTQASSAPQIVSGRVRVADHSDNRAGAGNGHEAARLDLLSFDGSASPVADGGAMSSQAKMRTFLGDNGVFAVRLSFD
jgi:hypothetical protein